MATFSGLGFAAKALACGSARVTATAITSQARCERSAVMARSYRTIPRTPGAGADAGAGSVGGRRRRAPDPPVAAEHLCAIRRHRPPVARPQVRRVRADDRVEHVVV